MKMLKLNEEQKKILLKHVLCTGYLKEFHGPYHLEYSPPGDDKWYFKTHSFSYYGLATPFKNSWKHNFKYELKKKEFHGVVVKIEEIALSSLLGVVKNNKCNITSCSHVPWREDGIKTIAATVYFNNGWKRLVPLDCICEYIDFSDGADTMEKIRTVHILEESDFFQNKITVQEDGSIEIANSYSFYNMDLQKIEQKERKLILNVRKRTAVIYPDYTNNWFDIKDEECEKCLDIMKKQMKEECGFEPDVIYGETNYDILANFASYPFNPELNEFSRLFFKGPSENSLDYNGVEFEKTTSFEEELKNAHGGTRKFFQYLGIPYTRKTNRIFLDGHQTFAEYYGILKAGFKDEQNIEKLMESDMNYIFGKELMKFGVLGLFKNQDESSQTFDEEDSYQEIGFSFHSMPYLLEEVDTLFRIFNYDEKIVLKLTLERLKKRKITLSTLDVGIEKEDIIDYMELLHNENLLPSEYVKKIGKEGFTSYNHDMLMLLYDETHLDEGKGLENTVIPYSDDEKHLEWTEGKYKFLLPENTDRLFDIGLKMNICVGHLYSKKALNKACIIVYAIKDGEYRLCVEVRKKSDGNFTVIQKSAFSNHKPQGEDLSFYNKWRMIKSIH